MINRVVLVGRITKDIELTKTNSNVSVVNFSLAVNNRTKTEDGKPGTTFLDCTAWRNQADVLANYAHKGSLIGVEGSLVQDNFTRRDGTKASKIKVSVENVTLLDKKESNNQEGTSTEPIDEPAQSDEDSVNDNKLSDFTDDDYPF